jgi:type IV pilus assembly protein PilV
MKPNLALNKQSGVMLIEALIAILIFAVGILGIVGLQANAIKQVTDAKFRSDAALLANQLIGSMWVTDRSTATLQGSFNSGKAGFTAWNSTVNSTLPVPSYQQATVVVDNNNIVTVTIYWLAPSEPATATPHQYVAIAQIK